MEIKTTVRYHLTHVRMAIISKSTKCWGGWGKRGTCNVPYAMLFGLKIGIVLMENNMKVSPTFMVYGSKTKSSTTI